jgi:hypothetical protein
MGRNPQVAISGRQPGPLCPESGDSEFDIAAYPRGTSRNAVTLLFPTLTDDALCLQALVRTTICKPFKINTCQKQKQSRSRNCTAFLANPRKNRSNPPVFSFLRITGLFSHLYRVVERITR